MVAIISCARKIKRPNLVADDKYQVRSFREACEILSSVYLKSKFPPEAILLRGLRCVLLLELLFPVALG
jgi:hypothetical protein